MSATKIVDEGEVRRWFEERRTYAWMVEQYKQKYNIDTSKSMWGGVRRRLGIDRRIQRDDELIPWHVKEEHRWAFPVLMLRAEARRRKGVALDGIHTRKLKGFLQRLDEDGTVVHYDPDTDEGWFYVPRRPDVDNDIIRVPERKTTVKPNAG